MAQTLDLPWPSRHAENVMHTTKQTSDIVPNSGSSNVVNLTSPLVQITNGVFHKTSCKTLL